MDSHVEEFYRQFSDDTPKGNFHKVVALHEMPHLTWETIIELAPSLPRGWFELARLAPKDKIDFLCSYWLAKLPYVPNFTPFLTSFFESLDDIGIYIAKRTFDDPFEAHLIYSIKNNRGFFRGSPPASDQEILSLRQKFSQFTLPGDYLAFLQIHNGFSKTTDCTGIMTSRQMIDEYGNFKNSLESEQEVTTSKGKIVDPKSLIPFYESFGMPFYQCFWSEWYPENEMGNVYFSGTTKTISDVDCSDPSAEGMAFPTFLDWLMFYLERIDKD